MSEASARPARFRNRVQHDYVKWETPGTAIEGFLVGTEKVTNAKKEEYRMLRLRTSDGRTIKATLPPVLADLIDAVEPGEEIYIVYVGEEARDGGNLKLFQVYKA